MYRTLLAEHIKNNKAANCEVNIESSSSPQKEQEIFAHPLDEKPSLPHNEKSANSMSQSADESSSSNNNDESDIEKLDVDTAQKSDCTFRRSPSPINNEISQKEVPKTIGKKEKKQKKAGCNISQKEVLKKKEASKKVKKVEAIDSSSSNDKNREFKALYAIEDLKSEISKSSLKNLNMLERKLKCNKALLRRLDRFDDESLKQLFLKGFSKQKKNMRSVFLGGEKKFVKCLEQASLLFLLPYYCNFSSKRWYNIF